VIEVISDASVTIKWFHSEGEEEVAEARALLDAHKARAAAISVLDLTAYEVGNGLLRGRAKASAKQVATVLDSLAEICPVLRPSQEEFHLPSKLASRHDLTLYDAAYAAVAKQRKAKLATLDKDLLDAGLGARPSELAAQLTNGSGNGEPG
jgi:predicted nucleic acid-binding protein